MPELWVQNDKSERGQDMTREEFKTATNDELIDELDYCGYDSYYGDYRDDIVAEIKKRMQEPVLDKIRAEIMGKIEQEEFARSVFRHEEKDTFKAEQCTGSIMAYNNVIKLIDKYKAESEE